MLEPKYQLPPPDLIDAVNSGELLFFVVGYVDLPPFLLVEWAAGLSRVDAIVCQSLYRDGELLFSQPGNELRQTSSIDSRFAKADPNLPIDIEQELGSSVLAYGLSMLELAKLRDPSNFNYLGQ